MARKTFISYKYLDARDLRDKIISALGDDAQYYKGENGYTQDMSDLKADTIKRKLADMMYDTSVTIVILSPHMIESKWIEWEIEYCLKNITRKNRTSHQNGIVGVIMKVNGNYDWLIEHMTNCHGMNVIKYDSSKLPDIIYNNKFNSNPKKWHCKECETYEYLNGGYITFVEEDEFLANIDDYIENAYQKSENDAAGYDIWLPQH